MRKILFSCLLLLQCFSVIGQEKYNYRYWFDVNDHKSIDGTSLSKEWHINVDVSDLDDALHVFNIQVQDSAGVWSSPMSKYFYKKNTNDYFVKYWFDGDISTAEDLYEKGATYIDVSHLKDGLHSISSVVKGTGALSKVETQYFLKLPQTVGVDYMTCFSFIDDKAYKQEKVSANGGVLNWSIDVEKLSHGLHKLQVFVVTPSGATTSMANGFFLRVPTQTELTTLKCYYTIDGEIAGGNSKKLIQAGTYENGLYHFDLDVASLSDGLHKLTYMLIGEDGMVTSSKSSFFYKTPLGGNAIVRYEYWVNENDSVKHVTELEKRENPLSIMTLLPVESCPIRSSCFEFRVEDKKPVLYAKNDFNFRIFDASGRFTDISRKYVDENVRQELKSDGIKALQSNSVTRVNRPAENEIKWYKFDAEEGDSLALNVDKACSIDVFSPTGKSVYSAMGAESVKTSGTHLDETGTYYVAIHDMTAKYGNEIKLNYQLIDKYAVLSQDVHKVGNGGYNTIKYKGNGFFDLYAVDLVSLSGDTIHCEDIRYDTNVQVYVTFNFENVNLDVYDAIFHFVEEDKIIYKNIIVEQSEKIELTTDISFPTTYLKGKYTTYTITVANKGNMTAYYVPIELKLIVNSIESISDIVFEGDIMSLKVPNELLNDSIDDELKKMLLDISYSNSDLSQFIVYKDSISNMDYGLSQIIMTIPPYSKKQIKVSILTNETDVSLYAYMTKDWYPLTLKNNSRRIKPLWTEEQRDWMCCQKERFKCSANIVANIASSLMPPGAGCATSLTLTGLETAYDVWCSEGSTVKERWDKYIKSEGNSLANNLIQSAVSCVTGFYDKLIKGLREDLKLASRLGSTTECNRIMAEIATAKSMLQSTVRGIYDGVCTMILGDGCIEAYTQKVPNCPPDPPGGGGGTSTPVNSLDPNDIRGYVAESGSKFIGKEVKTVNYMIEFENDSTFATASAHRIELIDTLDVNTLEISTLAPKTLRLGDREYDFDTNSNGVATIDMRPDIYAIAQVTVDVTDKGVLNCEIISLDPMTMEPTDDIMAGILPVNDADGRGQGYLTFDIDLKDGLADGTEIANKADIVFDTNEPISTPYWINTTDYVAPVSKIDTIECVSDTLVTLRFSGEDNRSGIWRYTLYVQPGDGSDWFLAKENLEQDSCEYKVYPEINYGFCVVATDSAGNVEPKLLKREISYTGFTKGDANGDGVIDAQDVVLAISKYLGEEPKMNFAAADVVQDGVIDAQDVVGIQNLYLHSNVNLYNVKRQRRTILKE